MTRTEGRERFDALLSQFRKVQDRNAWLCANPTHPDFATLDERADASGARFATLRDELADWCECGADSIIEVLSLALGEREGAGGG